MKYSNFWSNILQISELFEGDIRFGHLKNFSQGIYPEVLVYKKKCTNKTIPYEKVWRIPVSIQEET